MPPPYPSLLFRRPDAAFPQRGFRGGGSKYTRRVEAAVRRVQQRGGGMAGRSSGAMPYAMDSGGGTPLAVTQGATPPGGCTPYFVGNGLPPPTSVVERLSRCVRFGGTHNAVPTTATGPRGVRGGILPPDAPDACAGGAARYNEAQRGTTRYNDWGMERPSRLNSDGTRRLPSGPVRITSEETMEQAADVPRCSPLRVVVCG